MDRKTAQLIGDNIRRHRVTRRMTQEELADKSGLHRLTMIGIESGKRVPGLSLDNLSNIARALGTTIVKLLAVE